MGGLSVIKLQSDHQNQVTSVICRNIKPGHEMDYDKWAQRYLTFERKAPGYLGTTIIIPGGSKSSLRYIIRRYADKAAMEAWDNHRSYYRKQTITLHDITRPPLVWKHGLPYQA
jgi:antibiotic biosynthesis monooxygenase (ABM) superfamily enzyme